MSAKILEFRRLPSAQAELRRRIGQGLALDFQLGDSQGVLTLRQTTQAPDQDCVTLASGLGPLRLNRASALLSLLSTCPALLPNDDEMDGTNSDDWYWAFYNQCLSPQLREVFGHFSPSARAIDNGLPCELEVRLDEQIVLSQALLPTGTLEQLLAQPGWRSLSNRPALGWRLSTAVVLGRTTLTMRQLKSLRPGDVVLPEQPLFQPDGTGSLFLGRQHLQVCLNLSPTPHFVITALEETAMNAYVSEFTADPIAPVLSADSTAEDDTLEADAFDDLPLSLTLNCGRLSLTLGELKTLGAGSVLSLGKGTPGFAMLCHDDRPLAHGELVDVDGHIGLQITRLEIGR
jgi:type III secretion protein Q